MIVVHDATRPNPVVDVVVPAYNEERGIADCLRLLSERLAALPYPARITVADNASTDATLATAVRIARSRDDIRVVHLPEKGRGRALKATWLASDAAVVAYLDVDLSTDLDALEPLIAPLVSGHSDIAIGTRLAHSARVVRGAKREFISRSYNLLLRTTMGAHFTDAQCGFKAMRAEVATHLLPLVEDTGWFFDTEVLVLAERVGLRISEVPVDWIDDPDSKVDIVATAVADVRGCWRVGRAVAAGRLPLADLRAAIGRAPIEPRVAGVETGLTGQLVRFCVVGAASTLLFALLYLALHPALGAQPANFVALLVTAVLNTAANRAFTFGVRGRGGVVAHHAHGIAIFLAGWVLTSSALLLLHIVSPDASRAADLGVLIAANLVATLTRFVVLRRVFRPAVTA